MERAGKSLAKMKLPESIPLEELARAAWPEAVGKRIASHAWAKSLLRGNLIVEVDDAVWQKQLFHLRLPILEKMAGLLGGGVIQAVEFRIATPRRPPQPARTLSATPASDEANRIRDPGMRILYKQSRNKASA